MQGPACLGFRPTPGARFYAQGSQLSREWVARRRRASPVPAIAARIMRRVERVLRSAAAAAASAQHARAQKTRTRGAFVGWPPSHAHLPPPSPPQSSLLMALSSSAPFTPPTRRSCTATLTPRSAGSRAPTTSCSRRCASERRSRLLGRGRRGEEGCLRTLCSLHGAQWGEGGGGAGPKRPASGAAADVPCRLTRRARRRNNLRANTNRCDPAEHTPHTHTPHAHQYNT